MSASSDSIPDSSESAPKDTSASADATHLPQSTAPSLSRWLYNHNPFYVLSTACVMFGIHQICQDPIASEQIHSIRFANGQLLLALAGYTLFLTGTAMALIRAGRVWDDARTILLTILLLLVVIGIDLDKPILLLGSPRPMETGWSVAGLVAVGPMLALVVGELIFRGAGIALPWLYRGPLYLTLGSFYLVPWVLKYCLATIGDDQPELGRQLSMAGCLFFPLFTALLSLPLLRAAATGPESIAGHGTPWIYPVFPWSIWVMLAFVIAFRTFYCTISFHPFGGTFSGFQLYFLTPIVLLAFGLTWEIQRAAGLIRQSRWTLAAALLWPVLLLTTDRGSLVAIQFLNFYEYAVGSPIRAALAGVAGLWLYAHLRGERGLLNALRPWLWLLLAIFPERLTSAGHLNDIWQPTNWTIPCCIAIVIELAVALTANRRSLATVTNLILLTPLVVKVLALRLGVPATPSIGPIGSFLMLQGWMLLIWSIGRCYRNDRFEAVPPVGLAALMLWVMLTGRWLGAEIAGDTITFLGIVSLVTTGVLARWPGSFAMGTAASMIGFAVAIRLCAKLCHWLSTLDRPEAVAALIAGGGLFAVGGLISWAKGSASQRKSEASIPVSPATSP